MPSGILDMDQRFPNLRQGGDVEKRFADVEDYLFMLLESLRYVLHNLSAENFNPVEFRETVQTIVKESGGGSDLPDLDKLIELIQRLIDEMMQDETPQYIETLVTNTFITNELYSQYGAIADLLVNQLRTDYRKAQMYLARDKSNIDFLYIHDEEISFITAQTKVGLPTEQYHWGSRYFYWTDATKTQMTSAKQTEWPVIVYQYTEQVKGKIFFVEETTSGGQTYKVPVFKLGSGTDATWTNGTARIIKHTTGLDVEYTTSAGKKIGMYAGDDGYMDLAGLRRPTQIDFSAWDSGSFTETMQGGVTYSYNVDFDANGNPVRIYNSEMDATVVW